jgi:uncharacterized protein (TIGR00251 family)
MSLLELSEDAARGTVTFSVRVQPRASRDEISGALGGAMKIRLCAPAIENRANEALVAFLSDLLKTPKSAVRIQSGEHGRSKRVEIRGVTRQQILDLLQQEA